MIGRFRVLDLLGRGAMGVVYRGVDEILDRPVALKVMAGHGGDADVRMRFRREAQAAARLQHPNIITIYELGDHLGAPFMALELLEGLDLQRAIEAGIRPDPRTTLPIVLQVLAGLGHAHERGIVHRDIKPSNVFLPRRRPAKIMDFGVARLAGGATTAGMVVGTPNYMSPEQVRAGDLDGRSDLFSVGLILYELVTGEKAFQAATLVSLMYRIAHEDVDLSLIPRGASWDTLRAVLVKSLARDANERYADARAMAADLEKALFELGGAADWALASGVSVPAAGSRTAPLTRPGSLSASPEVLLAPEAPPPPDDDFAGETISLGTGAHVPAQPFALGTGPVPAGAVSLGSESAEHAPGALTTPRPALRAWPLAAGLAGVVLLGAGALVALRRPIPPEAPAPLHSAAPPATTAPDQSIARSPAPASLPSQRPSPRPSPTPTAAQPPAATPSAAPRPESPGVRAAGRVERADALLAARHFAAALAEARAVLAREPRNEDAQQIAEEAEASLLIESVLKSAGAAMARGDRETAKAELRRGLAVNGNDARLLALWREATQ
jgi:eukaryotic-like serine/threonine-protein kinase